MPSRGGPDTTSLSLRPSPQQAGYGGSGSPSQRTPLRPTNRQLVRQLDSRLASPVMGSPIPHLESKSGPGDREVLGLRDDAGLRLTSAAILDPGRLKTYIVATYTGELDEQDKNETWYVDPNSNPEDLVPPEELPLKEQESLVKKGYYTITSAGTDAAVWVELTGSSGKSGEQQLSHGPTLKQLVQTKVDDAIEEFFPTGLRFKDGTSTLTKRHKSALNQVAEILNLHSQVLRINIEGVAAYDDEENAKHPLRDRQPMENAGISRSEQLAIDRAKVVRAYLVERGCDPANDYGRESFDVDEPNPFTGLRGKKRLEVVLSEDHGYKGKEMEAVKNDPEKMPHHVGVQIIKIDPDWEHEHGTFQTGHVDEFAITCPDLGDLTEIRIWHKNDGHDLQSSRWKLNKVLVTCLQNSSKTAGSAGISQLHPHGKGDHAIRSVKTSDNAQWQFLPHRKWLSCDGGDNLLYIHDEIKRARRRIKMEEESWLAKKHEWEVEIERLEKVKKASLKDDRGDCPGREITIRLEDHRPLPPDPRITNWFEKEIYIDVRHPTRKFSFLLTYKKDKHAGQVKMCLNGCLTSELDGVDSKKPFRFVRPTREVGKNETPVAFDKTELANLKHRTEPWWWRFNCMQEGCMGEQEWKQFKLVQGLRPRDLERGFHGDKRTGGYRLEQSIWRLKPVTNNPHSNEYGLYYIVKDVQTNGKQKKAGQVALSLVDRVVGDDPNEPVPEEEGEEDSISVLDRCRINTKRCCTWLCCKPKDKQVWAEVWYSIIHCMCCGSTHSTAEHLSESGTEVCLTATDEDLMTVGKDWLAFRPVMVTDRNDEFIFEVQSKGGFLAARDGNSSAVGAQVERGWLGEHRGRTLNLMGDAVEGRRPCLTKSKWRSPTNAATDQDHQELLDMKQHKSSSDKQYRNDVTPTIRGHQLFRLSIPQNIMPPTKKDDDDILNCFEQIMYWLATWQGRVCLQVFVLIFAIVISVWITAAAASCDD